VSAASIRELTSRPDPHADGIAALRAHFALDVPPDLERDAGAGYSIRVYFRPDLAHAERAAVLVTRYGATIDALDVPARDALAAWRHTATVSEVYRDALTARPDAETCEVGA
jgi:hypothetical protein